MAIEPAAISARPARTTTEVATLAPDNPAASAKGTVNPSDIPITTSRTVSLAVKCCSTCAAVRMLWFRINEIRTTKPPGVDFHPTYRPECYTRVAHGGATASTGLNRDEEACRVPSSRKTIGKTKLPITCSLHTLLN